jgi:hypothetical protein
MAGQELVLSVPGNRAAVAVPAVPTRRQDLHEVTVTVPEHVLRHAEKEARARSSSVEEVLSRWAADGLGVKLQATDRDVCKDGAPHRRGSINPRHCMRCGDAMP